MYSNTTESNISWVKSLTSGKLVRSEKFIKPSQAFHASAVIPGFSLGRTAIYPDCIVTSSAFVFSFVVSTAQPFRPFTVSGVLM